MADTQTALWAKIAAIQKLKGMAGGVVMLFSACIHPCHCTAGSNLDYTLCSVEHILGWMALYSMVAVVTLSCKEMLHTAQRRFRGLLQTIIYLESRLTSTYSSKHLFLGRRLT
jgi:hypothetical protein